MGVPKFYRWISERYTRINQVISDNALLPEFDHLYLDMNGIIHGCTHPSDRDLTDVPSEKDMMLGIMHYLDRIITQIVKPKVSVYMAIDGVAPRAKLNQQRSRRFRSAKDLAEAKKDLPKDEKGETTAVFDSNCITPGTEFLTKVSDMIRFFIRMKIKDDPVWRGLTVIFSGSNVPGEGEHKIIQHIREMRCRPDYQPNNRHCIYGQDADLILLGLVTHEPHFTILREIVNFNSFMDNKNSLAVVKKFTKESKFQLLHLSILREYLQIEFCYQQPQYDLERTIDDFVFITFLVGNDFLPHMPTLDISEGAFDLLFDIYRSQREGWGPGEYLTNAGQISDASRLEIFLAAIGEEETELLKEREKNDAAYLKKKRRWDKRDGKAAGPTDAELQLTEKGKQNDYMEMLRVRMSNTTLETIDGWTLVDGKDKDFKGRYYFEKLDLTPFDKDGHWKLRKAYMEGLIWCLAYYYKGCISWGWFYPYHYGPMLSDLMDLPRMFQEISFDIGKPLTPFQQLMGCLPPASSQLVPKPYRWLMSSPESPILPFYPLAFEVDMNGKKNPWEGVNLLPFINIKDLIQTTDLHCPPSVLSEAEKKRNSTGVVFCYKFDSSAVNRVPCPNSKVGLPDLHVASSSETVMDAQDATASLCFEAKLIKGTIIPFPGFPSLNVLPIKTAERINVGLNCFGTASKYPNTILTLAEIPELAAVEDLAKAILGKSLFVNWPMMHEAKVVALYTAEKEVSLKNSQIHAVVRAKKDVDKWKTESEAMKQTYYSGNGKPGSGGVSIGEIEVRVGVLPLQGMRTNPANGATKKVYGSTIAEIPLQLCLLDSPAPDPRFQEYGAVTLADRFPLASRVVVTKGKSCGSIGTVVGVPDKTKVAVSLVVPPAEFPFGIAIAQSVRCSYVSSGQAARTLKMNPGVLGKILGKLHFEQGRYDLGLNLKSSDGLCVVGYSRKKPENEEEGYFRSKPAGKQAWGTGDSVLVVGSEEREEVASRIAWEYTNAALDLVKEYRKKYPELFSYLNKNPDAKKYDATEVFGAKWEPKLPEIRLWLDSVESAKLPRSPASSVILSKSAVSIIERASSLRQAALDKATVPESLLKIPGSALFREGSKKATDILSTSDSIQREGPVLGDRVVNLCADGIPFGARGTVVGIHNAESTGTVEVVMDREFVGGTSLQGHCSSFRGRLCLWAHLLKVSPENSFQVVKQFLATKGKQGKQVDKILATVGGKNVKQSASASVTPSKKPQNTNAPKVLTKSSSSEVKIETKQSSATLTQTSKSSQKQAQNTPARQGAWREANGPPHDTSKRGFTTMKSNGAGIKAWEMFIKKSKSMDSTLQLKSVLGMSRGIPEAPRGMHAEVNNLKAVLGVPTNQGNETRSTAANKLLQVLQTQTQPGNVAEAFSSQPFNFAYSEEGEQKAESAPTIVGVQQVLPPNQGSTLSEFPRLGEVHATPDPPIHSPAVVVPSLDPTKTKRLNRS